MTRSMFKQRAIAALGCRMHLAVSAGKSGAARWFPGRLADPVPRKFGLHAFYCVNAVFSVFAVEVENVDADSHQSQTLAGRGVCFIR